LTILNPKNWENLRRLFWFPIAIDRRGRITREGALDLRESRERRDKIFAEKTEHAKILDQKQQFSVGNFHFFGRGKTNFVVWGGV